MSGKSIVGKSMCMSMIDEQSAEHVPFGLQGASEDREEESVGGEDETLQ
jgi:hypothetical protein